MALDQDALETERTTTDERIDTALACLMFMARYHRLPADPMVLAHRHCRPGRPMDEKALILAARDIGLRARIRMAAATELSAIPLPAVGVDRSNAFFVIAKVDEDRVLIQRPDHSSPELVGSQTLAQEWTGNLILFAAESSSRATAKFDFTWFIPVMIKYRRMLGEVLLASLFLQLIGLVTPLLFQVVMDKVLVHRGVATLNVIAVAWLICTVFETLLSGLRTYLFSHTTSRIDVELGASLFRHLIALPLAYFQARRVGDSVARMREIENIRAFLTGNAITALLDCVFSVIFIAVMLVYSGWLTLVVLASIPVYVMLSAVFTPLLRVRVAERFTRGANSQAFLVESITSIHTLKSMAVEPLMTREWDAQLAGYVRSGFSTAVLGSLARESVGLVGKIVTVATIWIGARLVMDGALTVGQLVAFNMLAGRVSQPILRMAQLWTDFQQTGVSMERMGDILNQPSEQTVGRGALQEIVGHVELDNVGFRYRVDGPEILKNVSLQITPGEVVGIVGPSGSGKSTLTRLIQRLYVPAQGRVLVDGVDLVQVDPASLRRQIGVVLQENVLFNRTVRENIALADPGASLQQVINAATLAGAHEFIQELTEGYDTLVEEQGTSLSGGQRQRIAIARALLTDPRIVIFDEATSALDSESEQVIQANMDAICRGRTVIIIAHRLSSVRHAGRILVMERGVLVEEGSHDGLMADASSRYAQLYRWQAA
jgi:subfamily B ATP-binding cassette protein HlyB/CyaB